LRYDELMELSHFGAKVVHPPSVHPVRASGIPLWIKNTFHPDGTGTLVSDETNEAASESGPVRGITSIDRVAMVRLEGDGMVGVTGVAMRLFGALARSGVSVILITQGSSEHSICFAIAPEDLEAARQSVEAEFEIDRRAGDIDELKVEDDVSVVAVVGAAMCQRPGIAGRLFSILGDHGINVRAIAQGSSELNISLVVKNEDQAAAVRAIHQAFFEQSVRSASLFLAGVGGVGGALLEQLANERSRTATPSPWNLRLDGAANSKRALLDPSGIEPAGARVRLLSEGPANDPGELIEAALASPSPLPIFVDCTASDEMAEAHRRLLAGGVTVVTANKKPLAGGLDQFRELTDRAGLYHEATVGAGLPVVRTLADLLATGDEVVRIEGVLSGTASFLCGELARGVPFSEALARAGELGYTEPDPREDLGGEDAARKLLILARMAGAELERDDLDVEPWIDAEPWFTMDLTEFNHRLPELDSQMLSRQDAAAAASARLTYLASWDASSAGVSLFAIPPEHPCFDLTPGENLIAFHTRRYAKMPLVVRGPGAGPQVTAAGVFSDILRALTERGNRP
jgi:aspartokinase/homoserine dehydrogenase 1